MFSVVHLLKGISHRGYNLVRWLAYEFLPLSVRSSLSSRLTDLGRLLGFVTIVSVILLGTRGFAHAPLSEVWYAWVFGVIVAILLGNLVKECAVWVSARIANAFGVDFYRRGVTVDGTSFREVLRSDGTWRRCEFGDLQTTCEWTDRFGACYRSISAPRRTLRRVSPRY
jgi:hypothetical protein